MVVIETVVHWAAVKSPGSYTVEEVVEQAMRRLVFEQYIVDVVVKRTIDAPFFAIFIAMFV